VTAKTLFDLTGPLRKGGGRKAAALMLVDGKLSARCAGQLPSGLPESFKGLPGQHADLRTPAGRLIVVGCGMPQDYAGEEAFWEAAGAAAIDSLRGLKLKSATLGGELKPDSIPRERAAEQFAVGATLSSYQCIGYRAKPPKSHFEVDALHLPATEWARGTLGRELGEAINWSRALVDAPANVLTPQAFAKEAEALRHLGVDVKVLDERALEKLGAKALLAVGRASEYPPCMVVCTWTGRGRADADIDLAIAGKGLTFDGGGLNLKQRPVIEKMKFDMAGAAAVVGAMRMLAIRRTRLNVATAIPLCENSIDAKAYRPGDVIGSLSGLTIEVDNTDAEGRIVLADALAYLIKTHKPAVMVDIATLTGAIMSALHEEFAGLFTADEELARMLLDSGQATHEYLWRMPLSKRQDYLVDSEIADVKNMGAPGFLGVGAGSSISGAKFLERFAGDTRWAHLDIAGMAWSTRPQPGIPKGPTGFGVRLLDEFAGRLAAKAGYRGGK
jgi:leucyl aminopeptidase